MRKYWAEDEGTTPAAATPPADEDGAAPAAARDDGYGISAADAEAGTSAEAAIGHAEASASGGEPFAEAHAAESHSAGVSGGIAEDMPDGADGAGGSDLGLVCEEPSSTLVEVDEGEEEIPPSQPDEPLQPQPEVKLEANTTSANPEVKPAASLGVVGGQPPKSEDGVSKVGNSPPPGMATSTPPPAKRDVSMPPPRVPEKRLLGDVLKDPSLQKSRQLVLARIQVLKAELDKKKSDEATKAITACFLFLQQEI